MTMGRFIYNGVKVRWNDGRTETFRYDAEEQAREAEHYQYVENWLNTKSADYVGRRINWIELWRSIFGWRERRPRPVEGLYSLMPRHRQSGSDLPHEATPLTNL